MDQNIIVWAVLVMTNGIAYFYGYQQGKLQGEIDNYKKMLELLGEKINESN